MSLFKLDKIIVSLAGNLLIFRLCHLLFSKSAAAVAFIEETHAHTLSHTHRDRVWRLGDTAVRGVSEAENRPPPCAAWQWEGNACRKEACEEDRMTEWEKEKYVHWDVFVCARLRGVGGVLCFAVPSHLPLSENENVFLTCLRKRNEKKKNKTCLEVCAWVLSVMEYVFMGVCAHVVNKKKKKEKMYACVLVCQHV